MNVGTTVVTISNQIDANRWLQVVWRGGESQTRECFCPREPVVIQRLDLVLVLSQRPFGSRSHTREREREVLGLCPQLHEVLGSCGEPMEPLSQNGNEFSGVAAGLLQTFPIITGNCSRIAKIGGKKRLKESKRVSESDSLKSHFKGVLIIILILQIQWLYF